MRSPLYLYLLGIMFLSALAQNSDSAPLNAVTAQQRQEWLRTAQVWQPRDISQSDIWRGPRDSDYYEFEQSVRCRFIPRKPGGTTSKFDCMTREGKEIKVRYDSPNGKLYALPAASRLFWALGFGAVRSWPAKVICDECPEEPYENPDDLDVATRVFHPAVIDVKFPGETIEEKGKKKQGWSWAELDLVDEKSGGAPRAHRDALKLLAAFVQHGDNNAGQQKFVCLPGGIHQDEKGQPICTRPFLVVEDLGSTFGGAELLDERASMNLVGWARHRIWKDRAHCIADLAHTPEGTLTDPTISEEGRRFLSQLLLQLTDRQIEEIFRVGRAERRNQLEDTRWLIPIHDWVRVFKAKRDEIVQARCPSQISGTSARAFSPASEGAR